MMVFGGFPFSGNKILFFNNLNCSEAGEWGFWAVTRAGFVGLGLECVIASDCPETWLSESSLDADSFSDVTLFPAFSSALNIFPKTYIPVL